MNGAALRLLIRLALAALYGAAGWFHLTAPGPFLRIMPASVPAPEQVVMWTGLAEWIGAAALAQPFSRRLRQAAGIALALYALCVWPANFNHFALDMARPDHGWGLAYHLPRMLAQPLLIWLALWASEAVNWPFLSRGRSGTAGGSGPAGDEQNRNR